MKTMNIYRFLQTCFRYLLMVLVVFVFAIPALLLAYVFPALTFHLWSMVGRMILFSLGVNLMIVGEIPKDGKNYIIAGNHTSFIDIFLIAAFFRGRTGTVLLHEKLLKIPILSLWLRAIKAVPVNPKNEDGKTSGIRKVVRLLKEKLIHLVIFPEGTRTFRGEMGEFQPGAFSIAHLAGVDILPIGLSGSFDFKPKNRWCLKPGPVVIYVGEPIKIQTIEKNKLSSVVKNEISHCISEGNSLLNDLKMDPYFF